MSGIALALILSGAVIIRGAFMGLTPLDSFRDIFDRGMGGPGIPIAVDPAHAARDRGIHDGAGGGGNVGGGSGNPVTFPPDVERWRGLVATHFPSNVVNQALSVMYCESRGNPNATNPTSRAAGLFQHMPQYWDDRSRKAGVPGANIYEPNANVKVAGWLYRQSNSWSHWSCKPSV